MTASSSAKKWTAIPNSAAALPGRAITIDDVYRLGEWESIKYLLMDHNIEGGTVYLQVETLIKRLASADAAVQEPRG